MRIMCTHQESADGQKNVSICPIAPRSAIVFRAAYSTTGTVNRNFLVGVYWSPLSICSHMFRLS